MTNALLGPAPIIDGMIGLDGCNHVQLGKAIKILGRHVLRMLDAESAVALAVGLHDFAVEVKDDRNALIADGVRANLQAGGIGSHHAILHQRDGMHFVRKQPTVVGLIVERLEEIGGAQSRASHPRRP